MHCLNCQGGRGERQLEFGPARPRDSTLAAEDVNLGALGEFLHLSRMINRLVSRDGF
jgi:hypothetical protein